MITQFDYTYLMKGGFLCERALTWNHCSTRHGVNEGQKTSEHNVRIESIQSRLILQIRRKNDKRTKLIKDGALKRYELWRKYAA